MMKIPDAKSKGDAQIICELDNGVARRCGRCENIHEIGKLLVK